MNVTLVNPPALGGELIVTLFAPVLTLVIIGLGVVLNGDPDRTIPFARLVTSDRTNVGLPLPDTIVLV